MGVEQMRKFRSYQIDEVHKALELCKTLGYIEKEKYKAITKELINGRFGEKVFGLIKITQEVEENEG